MKVTSEGTVRMTGPFGGVEHEFAAFKADGLGPFPRLHQAAGHDPGCGLRRR
jgi:hypothetical protein